MKYVVVGLGNPGKEYEETRHNVGRMAVEHFAHYIKADDWREDKKSKLWVSKGDIGKHTAILVLPDTFMNKSGSAVGKYVTSIKAAERLIVVHDELDLPLGTIKISFGKGAGGHRGVDSVRKAVKTKEFVRVRVGVSKPRAKGGVNKPVGEEAVLEFILGKFRKPEQETLKKVFKETDAALDCIIAEGRAKAMCTYN